MFLKNFINGVSKEMQKQELSQNNLDEANKVESNPCEVLEIIKDHANIELCDGDQLLASTLDPKRQLKFIYY